MHQRYAQGDISLCLPTPVLQPRGTSDAGGNSRGARGRLLRGPHTVVLMALLSLPGLVGAQPMRWPEAVAALAAERTRAETCGRLLKRHAGDDAAALSRGELAYAAAKAEVDAVIAGLRVVLAQGGTPPNLADLEARLTRGVQAREAFCSRSWRPPPGDPGTRNLLVGLGGAVLPPLLEAARTSVQTGSSAEQDRLLRQTIQTQLEATQWPDSRSTPESPCSWRCWCPARHGPRRGSRALRPAGPDARSGHAYRDDHDVPTCRPRAPTR